MPDIMRDFACHACRAADGAQSPAEELEVALDAMFSMQAPFHRRYHLFSAMQRRVGGQGMVQFASIFHTQEQVCSCSRLPVHASPTLVPESPAMQLPLFCVLVWNVPKSPAHRKACTVSSHGPLDACSGSSTRRDACVAVSFSRACPPRFSLQFELQVQWKHLHVHLSGACV